MLISQSPYILLVRAFDQNREFLASNREAKQNKTRWFAGQFLASGERLSRFWV